MKIFLFFLLFSFESCCASNWSLSRWLQNAWQNKQYQAAQAYQAQDYEQSLIRYLELINHFVR